MKKYEKRSFPIMLEFEEAPEYADVFTMEEFIEAVISENSLLGAR